MTEKEKARKFVKIYSSYFPHANKKETSAMDIIPPLMLFLYLINPQTPKYSFHMHLHTFARPFHPIP